jgi:hypothetical protein
MMNRSKLVAAGLLFAAFAAGAAVGGAVSAAWGEGESVAVEPEDPPRRKTYAERLQEDLTLTPAQRDSVDAILDHVEPDMHALWEEIAPRFDSLRGAVRRDIMAVLDDHQQAMYAELIARSDSARAERHGRKNAER